MSMSDCIKCWDTPCTCGYGYRKLSQEMRQALAAVVLGVDGKVLEGLVPEEHPLKGEK